MNGLLLVNTGTPAAPVRSDVARFLRQFLSDREVIDLPFPFRQLLVRGIIVPFRAAGSAAAYCRIWTPEGSPLLMHMRALCDGVQARLGGFWKVAAGMRYGEPSIAAALRELEGCSSCTVLPLFPQFSRTTTGSILKALPPAFAGRPIRRLPAFFDDPAWIVALAESVARPLAEHPGAELLLSFHGLPERYVRRDCSDALTDRCCDTPREGCYRSQCFATARGLQSHLGIPASRVHVAFQSRLGRQPWLTPCTAASALELAVRHADLVVAAPSFTADCLETLDELGNRLRRECLAAGARSFTLAPCVNASDAFVRAVAGWAQNGI